MPYKDKALDLRWRRSRYATRRARIVASLGGCCYDCGADDVPLEFDHIVERTWSNRHLGGLQRLRRYEAESQRGEVVLRCGICHDLRHGFITSEEAATRRARLLNVDGGQMALCVPDPDSIDEDAPF